VPLAHGGLTSSPNEYLAKQRQQSLPFALVDAQPKGEYLYLQRPQFRANISDHRGIGTAPNLQWQFWNGAGWIDLAGFGLTDETNDLTRSGTVYWTGDPFNWAPYSIRGGPGLYLCSRPSRVGRLRIPDSVESLIKTDILLFQYCRDITDSGQEFISASRFPRGGSGQFLRALWMER
jgi:hypothetical protein